MRLPPALVVVAPIVASLGFAFISCDDGGEPPEKPDSGADVTVLEATGDASTVDSPTDAGFSEASSADAPDLADVSLDAGPCGEAGEQCCSGSTCFAAGYACNGATGQCSLCGGAGQTCCDLNACDEGGCCVANTCAGQTSICQGTDGALCVNNACGACGGAGQPCCGTNGNVCTAPQTLCVGDAGSGVCQQCGDLGELCCAGSSCAAPAVCNGVFCASP